MINFFFKTYGCQANVADSEGLASFLKTIECNDVHEEQAADLIVINTCNNVDVNALVQELFQS